MKHTLPLILGAGIFDSKKQFSKIPKTPPRKVKTYELEYFFESGGISVINGKEYPIKSGNLLLAKPGDIRYSHLPFRCKFLHFSVTDTALQDLMQGTNSVFSPANTKVADKAFSEIFTLFYSANQFDNIAACARLVTLLHTVTNSSCQELTAVAEARSFIENNYKDSITTETVAAACNMSVSYLHRLFKTVLNTTPGDFLLNCRISAAKELLSNTTLPLIDVAYECGFNSQCYFSDCFKRKTGQTPREFRKSSAYMP